VEALVAARDFEAAIRLANGAEGAGTPLRLRRALQFQAGAAQIEAGRYSEAGDTFEALRRERETAAVLNNLGVARFRMRDPEASKLFERAASYVDHRQGDISFNRSLALLFEGNADQALPALDAALAAAPSDVRSRLLRVWALRLLNRQDQREEEWERLIVLAPSFAALGNPDLARRLERVLLSERNPTP
jgi:tetratricopeptide (TPR) repeat protein